MKPSERDFILYLEDIVLSMQRIQEYIKERDLPYKLLKVSKQFCRAGITVFTKKSAMIDKARN